MSTLPQSFTDDKQHQYHDFLVIMRWSAAVIAATLIGLVVFAG